MKLKAVIFILIVFSIFLSGCNNPVDFPEPIPPDPPEPEVPIDDPPEEKDPFVLKGKWGSYKYIRLENFIEISAFLWEDQEEEVIIPEEIDQLPVISIGERAFYQTFERSVIIPESVKIINASAFYRCYYLEEISLSKNIIYLGNNPFFRCSSLRAIHVSPENQRFSSLDGVLFNKDQTVLLSYPEGKESPDYVIPDSVTEIDEAAFGYHTKLKNIYIPSSVQKISEYNIFIYPDDIVLHVKKDSVGEAYAKRHELSYVYW